METGLVIKANAPEILDKQLKNRAAKNQYGIVVVGSATDAYMPHEQQWRMTESLLKVLLKYRFPVFISTKRNLILRDIALLREIDAAAILPPDLQFVLKGGVILSVSISTMDDNITRMLEPGTIAPLQRMELVQQLQEEGFLTGVNAIPILPFIADTDIELEKIIAAASTHRANYILAGSLTLFGTAPADSKTLYYKFLEKQYPHLLAAYDKLYNGYPSVPRWYQQALAQRVSVLCNKYNIRNSII